MANEISDKSAEALPYGLMAADANRAFRALAASLFITLITSEFFFGLSGPGGRLRGKVGERAHAQRTATGLATRGLDTRIF